MSGETTERHPFLDDLTPDAEFTGTVLRRAVSGRDNIRKLIMAVGALYKSQTPIFVATAGSRTFLSYEAELAGGSLITGFAVVERNEDGSVPRVSVTFSPLGAALSLSGQLGERLAGELGEGLFL